MADAVSKVNIFFEAEGSVTPTGWTETFYSQQPDLSVLVAQAVDTYVPARRQLLGQGAEIKYVRVSNVPPNRSTFISYMTGKQGLPNIFTNSPADDYDPTQVDLLVRMQTTSGKRRQFWMGGLPDSVTDTGQESGVRGAFTSSSAWKSWVRAIGDLNWGIRFQIAAGPPKVYSFEPMLYFIPVASRRRARGRPFNLFRGRKLV